MMTHLNTVVAGGLLLFVAAASPAAWDNVNRTTYLTFSHSVALPGVQLAPGTYIFELVSPMTSTDLVRVSSRDGSKVYLTAFTNIIARPAGLPADRMVSLGEAARGAAPPVQAWFPIGKDSGYQFRYYK